MERGPPNMTVSPTPEYPGYGSDNSTQIRKSGSSSGSLNWPDILSLLIAPLGLVRNGAVLWLLGFRIRRNYFSVYILNLAAADALFLCSSLLIYVDDFVNIFYYLTWTMLLFLRHIFYIAGMSLLTAISTERCLSALFPIWYRCRRPKHTSAAVCAWLWALPGVSWLLTFVLSFFSYDHFFIFPIIAGAWLLLLTCIMCVSSLTLLLRVQCSSRRRRPPRLYLLVLLTVLVFLLCGLPLGIGDFIYFYSAIKFMPYWFYEPLACVNSSVNPLIYFFVGRLGNRRREPLREVLQRALGDEQELGDETTNTPHTTSGETTLSLRRCSDTGALERSSLPQAQ
ncbi:mas-related G-protein coupled receptor member A-like [Sarcophilus harrisii]|uniref:G-protein coupled receptors family 1 profile domain-containing protein n=1 Tax=Sarcophilus harrisii TaxID=9305 RepID=A0A7N4P0Q8_SARHA|nr:mas-related G-protein coupled receptor member A-like [Sarcophilus harrisii]